VLLCAVYIANCEEMHVVVEENESEDMVSVSLRDTASSYRDSAIWDTAFISLSSSSSGVGEKCVQRLSEAEHCDLRIGEDIHSGANKFFVTIFSKGPLSTVDDEEKGERVEHFRQVLSVDLEHHPSPAPPPPPPADKEVVSSTTGRGGWKRGLLLSAASSLAVGVAVRRHLLTARPKPSPILPAAQQQQQQQPTPSNGVGGGALMPVLLLGLAGLVVSIASRAIAVSGEGGSGGQSSLSPPPPSTRRSSRPWWQKVLRLVSRAIIGPPRSFEHQPVRVL